MTITTLLVLFVIMKANAKDMNFQLKDSECKMIGAAVGEQSVKTIPGVANTNSCTLSANTLSCIREGAAKV